MTFLEILNSLAISSTVNQSDVEALRAFSSIAKKRCICASRSLHTGQWKSSGSFSRNEIPLAIYCLQKCFEHMIEGQKDDDSVEEEVVM
jgi:hypothetical protein